MNTAPQADSQASAFASLTALRDAHTELLLSSKKGHQDAVQQGLIRNFLARAKATGSRLDAPIEREAAQNILMYWDSQLYSASDKATLDAALPRLDPFDPINSPDLSNVKSPFRGLSAFGEGDAARFLGREQAVKTLLEKLAEQPTVLVVGPAGSGKTSLVFAGVVPALKLRLAQDDKNPVVLSSSPGVHPLASLLNSILDAAGPHAPPDAAAWFAAQRQKLSRSPDMFGALLESIFPGRPAILIVDPLGDIFALCRDQEEREAFGKALISATRSAGDSNRLILIVDDRYREAALQFAAFKSLEQNKAAVYSLPPLAPADVIRAVTAAADTVGLKFDDGILEDLAKDIVGDASALPALQFTLGRLWDKRQGNRVTWDAYHGDHGVGRPREALRRTAESVFADLSDDREREAARELFLQLVRPQAEGRSGGDFTRRRVRRDVLEQLPASGRTMKAIDAYEKAGLVRMMPGSHPEDDSFEVAHEALVDAWPRLREWLQEDREASRKLLQLVAIARRWQEGGADPRSGYLLSGKALEDAELHVSEAPEIGEFVFASKRELQRKERWAKWLRNGVIAVLTILLVFAAWQWRRAEYEAELALRSAENAFKAVNLMLDVVSADRLKGTINVKAAEELLKSAEVIVNAVEDRPELLKTRIDLLSKISDIDVLLNKQEEALDRLQMADRLSQRFVKDKTSDEDWAAYGYQIDYKIGDIKAGQNKPDEALPRYESALDMGRRLAQLHPDDIVKQCNVPFIMNKIGDIYFSGKDWLRALDKYNESRAIGERLMKEHSTDPNASKTVGDAMARIANTLLEMKKYNDAFEEYNAVIKIQEGLVQSAPENDVYLSNLSRSHGNLGTAYLKNGRVPEALNEYRKAQRDQEKLALKDDSNADWKVALARDYMSIGDACRTTDETKKPFDLACAETNYRRAVEIRDALADKMQGCADCQAAAANSHQYLGIVLTLEQKFEAAAAEFKTEAEYRGRRAKSDPLNAEYQAALADAFDRLGDALTKAGKNEEALGAYQSGLSGIETFLSAKPDDKLSAHHDAFQGKIKELAQPGQ